jgi:shikimate dehydrogenase
VSEPIRRLAVLGHPVSHSRSPAMQNAALEAVGLAPEWHYEAIDVAPEDFAAYVAGMPAAGFVGANVTIPHKEAALALADERSAAAAAIGAANTLSFTAAGGVRAANTDAPALIEALPIAARGRQALVLGAGGAARAAAWALREAGAAVALWNRTAERAAALAAELDVAAVPAGRPPRPERAEILVNATSVGLGAADDPSSDVAGFKAFGFGADQLHDRLVVVDLVYGAAETELVRAAEERGATTIDGLEILVRQGAASFAIWTGLDPPLKAMRRSARSQP